MRRLQPPPTYIWQQKDWPKFHWDSSALADPLSRLSYLHGLLSGRMSVLGFNEKNTTALEAMTDELISSSEIEGIQLNAESVRSSIARRLGIEEGGMLATDHYVEGLVDVMIDAIKNHSHPLSSQRLFDWHAALFPTGRSGMYRIAVAQWRTGEEPMRVVSGAFGHEKIHYEAPPSAIVAEEMQKMFDWYNFSEINPYIKGGIVHLWFVSIHPFDDGNGRISRTLADMTLSSINDEQGRYYSISAEIIRHKKSYYEILELTQKGNLDITEWLLWFLNCLEEAIKRALSNIDRTLRKAEYWDIFHGVEINERQRKIINRLWDGFDGKLTSSKWAKICHCSQDTASRDIHDLIEKGMLRDSGEKGRNTHYLLADREE